MRVDITRTAHPLPQDNVGANKGNFNMVLNIERREGGKILNYLFKVSKNA